MSQVSIAVFVKRNRIIGGCPPQPQPDGCVWHCPHCREVVIRVSFGMMNGVLHCACGAEVELIVDGHIVDIEELNVMPGRPDKSANPVNTPAPAVDDEAFLRGCGISVEEEQ